MRVVVLQPGYLPWLGFFDQMARCDTFVVYDDVGFDKNGWRNRNRVKTRDGVRWLTVPVLLAEHSAQPRIRDVRIDPRAPWARKHLATIEQSYRQAPFFEPLFGSLQTVLSQPYEYLVDLDLALIDALARRLGLKTRLVRSSELGVEGERVERLVRICRRLGADRYLSGNAAQCYLDEERFREAGISVAWQNYRHPEYPQLHGGFEPHLSVIDLMFNCGADSLRILRMPDATALD